MASAFTSLVEQLQQELRSLVRRAAGPGGKVDLVLDQSLVRVLNCVAGFTFLKELGVDAVFRLEAQCPPLSQKPRMYLTRTTVETTKTIADHLTAEFSSGAVPPARHIVFVPQRDPLCEHILEEEGVYGYAHIDAFQMDLAPIDNDLLTMHLPLFLRDSLAYDDHTALSWAAKAILRLEAEYGPIPHFVALGEFGNVVLDLLRFFKQSNGTPPADAGSRFSSVIMIDRQLDAVTPLCSQLIYTGLVDEMFGYDAGFVNFGEAVTGNKDATQVRLRGDDPVYASIRDENFSNVGKQLKEHAKKIGASYEEGHTLADLAAIRGFIDKLGDLKAQHYSLQVHTAAAEAIMMAHNNDEFTRRLELEFSILNNASTPSTEWLEECIYRQTPLNSNLRLLCIMSLARGGLPPKLYDDMKRIVLHSYGYEHLTTFDNLRKMGLFRMEEKTAVFPRLRKRFQLMQQETETESSSSGGAGGAGGGGASDKYVYYGYMPASVALIEQACKVASDARVLEDLSSLVAPKHTAVYWRQPGTALSTSRVENVLVFFLGGCTLSELSALRKLGRATSKKFVVATTDIISGERLMNLAREPP
eukprot:m.139061 g.139061  ORF g.139061 m.139061 type:complete len:587 (+) comp16647_c0_seq2:162-1922(+)